MEDIVEEVAMGREMERSSGNSVVGYECYVNRASLFKSLRVSVEGESDVAQECRSSPSSRRTRTPTPLHTHSLSRPFRVATRASATEGLYRLVSRAPLCSHGSYRHALPKAV